ncbi:hypothetical protein [Pseudoalteromonas rubra]|uniref:hypothetical protein n=1 Tax=Pseudoalteromonas rubra TaxID=43658 RepID=UPI002DB665AD|nr:hypothetical protein [Pseudoalteromonas rubra]MEC4090900.1 hypothetical protein [Pseudoalteromonas rubra]
MDYPTQIPSEFQARIENLVLIFNHGAKAYKLAQSLLVKIDDRIHNEYAYCARAVMSILDGVVKHSYDEDFELALSDSLSSARHILNDCLDIIVSYAIKESDRLKRICRYSCIQDVYSDYHKVRAAINDFVPIIAQSRADRGKTRVATYIEMVESDGYKLIIEYCQSLDTIEELLKKKRRAEKNSVKLWGVGIIVAVVSASVAIIKLVTQ